MSMEVEGLNELLESLGNLADTSNLEAALGKACALVEASAKTKAPKGNGDLRRSITSKVQGDEGVVFTPLEYAPYVEYGTGLFAENGNGRQDVPWVYIEGGSSKKSSRSKKYTLEEAKETVAYLKEKGLDAAYTYGMKPTPYMRPALNENREEILRIIKENLLNG